MKVGDPRWRYVFTSRFHLLQQTYSLHTLALAAYHDPELSADGRSIAGEVVDRINAALSGGREPECQGGLGGWTHGPFALSLLLARQTPSVWERFTPEQQAKVDLIMQAMAVAAHFTQDDDNDFKCMVDGDGNYQKSWNPNMQEGYGSIIWAAALYFGVDELDAFFLNFDFDRFLGRLESAGFTNVVACWTRTPATKRVMMEGGSIANDRGGSGSGLGVRNTLTFKGHPAGDAFAIYAEYARRQFSQTVDSTIDVGTGATTRILGRQSGATVSPYEGRLGMCYEFRTTDAHGIRSALHYVHDGWQAHIAARATLEALGLWPDTEEARGIQQRIIVGSEDLVFKLNEGYASYSNGRFQEEDRFSGGRFDATPWTIPLWRDYLNEGRIPQIDSPGVARQLLATITEEGAVRLRWLAPEIGVADSYEIVRTDLADNSSVVLGTTSTRAFLDTEVAANPGQRFSYTVYAENDAGKSSEAKPFRITTGMPSPYKGVPHTIPGRIEAEDFDLGGAGVAFIDEDAGMNSGENYRSGVDVDLVPIQDDSGIGIGWMRAEEWTTYTVNVAETGYYAVEIRYSSQGGGGEVALEVDANLLTIPFGVPNTGGWQSWRTVALGDVFLKAGVHRLRLHTFVQGININWIEFTRTEPADHMLWQGLPVEGAPQARHSPWFGLYYVVDSGYVYHEDHGWLFLPAMPGNPGYYFDLAMGAWAFTDPTVYPFLFAFRESPGWAYFLGRDGDRRSFFDLGSGTLFTLPRG